MPPPRNSASVTQFAPQPLPYSRWAIMHTSPRSRNTHTSYPTARPDVADCRDGALTQRQLEAASARVGLVASPVEDLESARRVDEVARNCPNASVTPTTAMIAAPAMMSLRAR